MKLFTLVAGALLLLRASSEAVFISHASYSGNLGGGPGVAAEMRIQLTWDSHNRWTDRFLPGNSTVSAPYVGANNSGPVLPEYDWRNSPDEVLVRWDANPIGSSPPGFVGGAAQLNFPDGTASFIPGPASQRELTYFYFFNDVPGSVMTLVWSNTPDSRVFPSPVNTPEGGSALAMLGAGLIGLAAASRIIRPR